MQEQFQRSIQIPGNSGLVWETVTEVDRVASWVSIVGSAKEIEPLSRYSAVLADKLGPFKLEAPLDINVTEVEPGQLVRVHAAGEDRQVRSRISVDITLSLLAQDSTTEMEVSGQYEVTGRVATMGASSIRKKANKILDEFFTNAENDLSSLASH